MGPDTRNRNQQTVPDLQTLILFDHVPDRLIECCDFRFQPGDYPGHGGIGRCGPLARAAAVGPLHPRRAQRLPGTYQITQLAQSG